MGAHPEAVFVSYIYEKPPVLSERTELARIQAPSMRADYTPVVERYDAAFESRKATALSSSPRP